MGHVLMIESWVGSMSTALPQAIRDRGDRFTLVTRDLGHYLRGRDGSHPLLGAANIITAETNDERTLLPYLEQLHRTFGFDGVISSCDYYLPTVAAAAAALGLPGPARDAVRDACDKARTRRRCAAAGVPQPRFAVSADRAELLGAAAEFGYPVVVKPVDLCGGMFVRRVDDPEQLTAALAEIAGFPVNARGRVRSPEVLVEQCLHGPEFSVETITTGGRTTVVGITDKTLVGAPYFIEAGHMFPAEPPPRDAARIVDVAVAAIAALGLDHLVAHTEIKLTDAGPRLIEVNPRPGGNRISELVRRVTGIDLPGAAVDLALGRAPDLRRADTAVASAAVAFTVPDRDGVLTGVSGAQGWDTDSRVVDYALPVPGRTVAVAQNNNSYLGHVLVTHEQPGAAGELARELLGNLRLEYAEGGAA